MPSLRWVLAASLIAVLSSTVSAEVRFARPPAESRSALPSRAAVREALAANRAANLARFRAYQRSGVFPSNTYSDRDLNVWRDAAGRLCAAATIMAASGQYALVERVARADNFIRLGDVRDGALLDWILTSGFTQREIAAIQKPFSRVSRRPGQPPDADLRTAEDRRLRTTYRDVEAALLRDAAASLEEATDRAIAHPAVAARLLSDRA
jgi:hypothetical protein